MKRDPDFNKSFKEIVIENGFKFETHPVTTEDGYILNVFRITSDKTPKGAPAVFMMHGITDSADCWIMNYADKAPAFSLVREGYDVWLGNQRGTKHSMEHKTLSNKDKKYWEFSWTEMGKYDAPAQIDYVRKHTGQKKVSYIGHSQGTSQMFYALSAFPDFWESRLNLFVALAPVTALSHCTAALFKYGSRIIGPLQEAFNIAHVYSILGPVSATGTKIACGMIP